MEFDSGELQAMFFLSSQHGPDAPIRAAMRADEMHEKGDVDGYAVWRRVVQAVEELRF